MSEFRYRKGTHFVSPLFKQDTSNLLATSSSLSLEILPVANQPDTAPGVTPQKAAISLPDTRLAVMGFFMCVPICIAKFCALVL